MSIIDRFLSVFAPYECLACGAEGSLLCVPCSQGITGIPERCYDCKEASAGFLTCDRCRARSRLYAVRAAIVYSGIAKELVHRLKFSGAKSAARTMAALLPPPIGNDILVVPVPTASSRVRGRGFDQAVLLARAFSRHRRLPYSDPLIRIGRTRQVGTSRSKRASQLEGAFRIRKPDKIRGRRLLLIDDVITTGATLEAAASALKAVGAGRIEAVAFAHAEAPAVRIRQAGL